MHGLQNLICRYPLLCAGLAILFTGCQTVGPGGATGGAFGTFAGSLTGAAIGAKDGKAPEGALIGAITGGTLGTLAGNAVDREVERDRLAYQQAQQQQRIAAVDVAQVIQMTQSGLSTEVIARQIQSQGIARRPSIDDLIILKNQGVDDLVIQAMQNAPLAGAEPVVQVIPQPVEVIREPVFVDSFAPFPYRGYRPPHRRPCRTRGGISVSF